MKIFDLSFWTSLLANRRFLFLFVALVSGIVIFHRLNEAYLGGDDTYYSEIAKEMVRTGDYLTPHNGGFVDFHTSKPPLLYWMNALSGKLFGFTSGAMRLPSAALGFCGVIALFFFVSRYAGPYPAFISALVLTFTQQYLYHARSAVTDGPFTVFFALSLMAFYAAAAEKKNTLYYAMGFFLGCAVMTRQLPGFFILPVIAAYIVLAKEYGILKNPHFYGALALAAAVILPWHLIMYARHGRLFLDLYFGVALKTGLFGYPATYSANPSLNPWYAYFEIIASNYEPWLPFLTVGIYSGIRHYKTLAPDRQKLTLFLLAWVFVPLALFQAAKVKQYHYINPLYVPFAVLTAFAFAGFKEKTRVKAGAVLAVLTASLAVSYLIFPIIPRTLDSREFNDTIKLVPEAAKRPKGIYALDKGFSHYSSCFMFYGDAIVTKTTEPEIVEAVRTGAKRSFVLSRETAARVEQAAGRPLRVVAESRESVLAEPIENNAAK